MLLAEGVVKVHNGRRVLDGVDLEVAPGQIVGLLGPNGAGKTTFVSIVSGLVRPDAGLILVGGVDVTRAPSEARRQLGVAPQETGVYPTLTCRQNLRFFGELSGIRRRGLVDAVDRVAVALGLANLLDRRAGELSGGERRRLHTAIALIHRPPLILLDEPTTGADVATRAELLALVDDVAASGSAVVYSTHYLSEIEQLAASVVILDRGRVLLRGSVADLVASRGTSVVEVRFDGATAPPLVAPTGAELNVEGPLVRIRARDATQAARQVLAQLGPSLGSVQSFEVVHPSLETVFLEVTGRRYDQTGEASVDVA
jgi:ABC-2 type transport system ATP-binding protein